MDNETLIPVITILGSFSIPIAWFYFDSKAKERRARVIEKALDVGKSPEEAAAWLKEPETAPKRSSTPFRRGLILMAIGAALLFVWSSEMGVRQHDETPLPMLGVVLLFLGIAFFLSDLMNRGRNDKE